MTGPRVLLEVCVDTVEAALAAAVAGADRLELCGSLSAGGTTPSAGAIAAVRARIETPLMVLVRPRAGDFVVSDAEFTAMARDVEVVRDRGAQGVVLGVLQPDGSIDEHRLERLVAAAGPLEVWAC